MCFSSPLQELTDVLDGCSLFVKREDLLPFSFGGNKYRIACEFFRDMEEKGYDCIIGYGNVRSNMCRAVANIAKSRNIPCFIISPKDNGDRVLSTTSNSTIVSLCDAIVYSCERSEVSSTIEKCINDCISMGLKPYYINGNKYGRGNEKTQVIAYYKVYKEIRQQSKEIGKQFDYIFITTGTGMSLAGLIAGQIESYGTEHIVGLSIAREKETEIGIVTNLVNAFYDYNTPSTLDVEIDDSGLCGGYGLYNKEIIDTVKFMLTNYGLPLDFTYTGKAFTAMIKYLKRNSIHGNVLFIHTGGTPLFFDNLHSL